MDTQIDRMFRKARTGKAVLFLGAGTSASSGAPCGKELAKLVLNEFKSVRETDDLMEACDLVLDTPGIDRIDVEEFIRKMLDKPPSVAQNKLPLNTWQAIFTTNYDDLIETAYRNCPSRKQRCEPIFSNNFSRRSSDYYDLVRLFKLMGCVNGKDDNAKMALSRSDYNKKLRHRGGLLNLVYDFVKDGTIIYAGYSFRDLIAKDILDEVVEEVGFDRLPWGWALLPAWDKADEDLLNRRKVLPLKMTFESFIEKLLEYSVPPADQIITPGISLTIMKTPLEIKIQDLKLYSREFQILHDDLGNNVTDDSIVMKRSYLEGKIDPWVGISKGWAFSRASCNKIQDLIHDSLEKASGSDIPIILMQGPAGSGKSTIARIVAYNIYKKHGFPAIWLKPENDQIDFVIIDSFCRQIEEGLRNTRKPPLLIVIDEAAGHFQDIRGLRQNLSSRGIPAVILTIARENEWKLAQGEQKISLAGVFNIPDLLDIESDEGTLLLKHLRGLEVLVSSQKDDYWLNIIRIEYENSFSTTLYSLAEPTRPPIDSAIKDEYEKLSPIAREAYRYVCAFYQFSIPMDLELLARALGCSYDRFIEAIFNPAAVGVIVEETSEYGDSRFRARSRLVAERVISHVYGTGNDWLKDISVIVKSCLPHNSNEVKTVRNMLIHRIGPRGAESKDLALLTPIFQAALDAGVQDSVILHHFALLHADLDQFDESRKYAKMALNVLDDNYARVHFKNESRQNINNTLGVINAKEAIKCQSSGAQNKAIELFQIATNYFHAARFGEFANAYPFYCEASMLYHRARVASGSNAILHIAEAFQVLDEAEDNIADDGVASIKEMEAKLVEYLSEFSNLNNLFDELTKTQPANVAYLKARYPSIDGGEAYNAENAYKIIIDSLSRTPDHLPSLRYAAWLHHKLYPKDYAEWKKYLDHLYKEEGTEHSSSILFNLGYATAELDNYNEALKYFEELERISQGHPKRAGIVQTIKDEERERRISGIVVSVISPREGWVKSEAIAAEVRFFPRKQRFNVRKGVSVSFALAVNYRGFLAVDLLPE